MLDFEYSTNAKLKALGHTVNDNPDDHDSWKELLDAVLSQDGRLNRGSDPESVAGARATYNEYLTLYPLSQQIWIDYAELEFRLAGAEAAEYIYERAVGSCASSVEIWTKFYEHRKTTAHKIQPLREVLERAADSAGRDFYADPIWDAYLLLEQKNGDTATLFDIYKRIIKIPLFHYARYFNDFRALSAQMPLEAIESTVVLQEAQSAAQEELKGDESDDLHAAVRSKIDTKYWESFQKLQEEVNKRWHWEQHIGKDGGKQLEEAMRVSLWTEYLEFEEQKREYDNIRALYERCLTYNSTHIDFWYRYARWLTAQPGNDDEARNAYRRASCLFAPVYDPAMRLQWAKFEEAYDRPAVAADIYEAVLEGLPDNLMTHNALTMLYRRQYGLETAAQSLAARIEREKVSPSTKGGLVVDWARLVWRETGDVQAARQVFTQYQQPLTDVASFWAGWLTFEIEQPTQHGKTDRAREIYQTMQQMANLPAPDLQELGMLYMRYLDERAEAGSIAELVELDAFVNGPGVLRSTPSLADPVTTNGQSS